MDYLQSFKKEFKNFKIKKSFKENIEPEEVLLDAEKSSEFPDQKLEIPLKAKVFIIFFGIIILGLSILLVSGGDVQCFKSVDYLNLSERNSIRAYPIAAPRGLIYDRNLKAMVGNLSSPDIFLSPQDLPKEKNDRDTMIEQICDLLFLNPKDVNQELADFNFEKEQRILLVSDVSPERILALESRKDEFPALSVNDGIIRQYSYGESLANILGYTGKLTKDDLINYPDYSMSDRMGKGGLEAVYEDILRGKPGDKRVEVDAKGQQIKELGVSEPVAGQNILTTIDLDLQQKIYQEVQKTLKNTKATKGAVVAMDPSNGQIRALLSFPGFDDNIFEQSNSQETIDKLWSDADKPFIDRAIEGKYASGSIIKPLMASAALEEGIVTPSTTIFDPGSITIVNQYNPAIVYNYVDWKAHGTVNLYSALAQSCDVYFYTIGGGWNGIEGLGVDRIKKYFELFGLGQKTGIDLPGEKSGLVPDPAWKQEAKGEQWYLGDTYHLSIGQGDLLVTPLQMASAISSIFNGGKLYRPSLVDKIIDSDKNSIKIFEPVVNAEIPIKQEYLDAVKKGMRESVISGTSRILSDLPVKAAGKTGTAQVAGQKNSNAWFVGVAPYDNPELVLVILVEDAGEGSIVSAPIANEVFKWYFSK